MTRLRKIRLVIFALSIALLSAITVRALPNRYAFTNLSTTHGLSSSCVKSICQDSNGFMWIGTKNGLNRYDGVSIRQFACYDSVASRGNDNISALYEDDAKNIWIGTDRGVYVFDPRTERVTYKDVLTADGIGAEDWVATINGDNFGNIWVLIPNQGVFRFHDEGLHFYDITKHGGNKDKLCQSLYISRTGGVLVGTSVNGIYKYEPITDSFRPVGSDDPDYSVLEKSIVYAMTNDTSGKLQAYMGNGEIFDITQSTHSVRKLGFKPSSGFYGRCAATIGNECWIGTQDGIYVFDKSTGEQVYINSDSYGTNALSDNTISCLYVDRDGNLWIGTMFGGLDYYRRGGFVFDNHLSGNDSFSLSSKRVRGLAIDNDGKVWIGTEERGVDVLDPVTGKVDKLGMRNRVCLSMSADKDNIYVGYSRNGFEVFHEGKVIEKYTEDLLGIGNPVSVYSLKIDSYGNLWMGADWGLFVRSKGSDVFEAIPAVGSDWICNLYEDSKGRMWICSMGNGLWRFDPDSKIFKHYPYTEDHVNGLLSNSVSSVIEDRAGNIWVSTDRGGLLRYDYRSDSFESIDANLGIPGNMAYDVLEDEYGYLWFGTTKGLVKYSPRTKEVKVFQTENGLLVNQFNYNSAVKDANGIFYFGGIDGLVSFDPSLDISPDSLPELFFTSLRIGNEYVLARSSGKECSILYASEIDLPHEPGSVGVSIGAPYFDRHNSVRYSYRLLPHESEWSQVTDPANLVFAGLASGSYVLEVRMDDGLLSNTKALKINVARPWYAGFWAWSAYLLCFVMLMYLGTRYYRTRQLVKMQEAQAILTISREKELYKNKMNFFTEIAHEIRTPLTLISTPLEAIEELGVADEVVNRYLTVIRQNTSRLLELTGQLLDFQKLDNEREALKFESVDVAALMTTIINRFEPTFTLKNKKFSSEVPVKPIVAHIERESITKIVSNLLNNALKYSDDTIRFILSSDQDFFYVKVISNGNKIKGEDQYKIFDPFYQIGKKEYSDGVGIGLPLSLSLAKMHGGNIGLENLDGPDNTFVLTIPLKQDSYQPDVEDDANRAEYLMTEDTSMPSDRVGAYSMLFVDDNDEMRHFLYEQLSKSFTVETAANGNEALERLRQQRFDIIVTDIMMPEMDGYELCRTVKSDENLSHIPVVFLTAKNDLESKVAALKCGGESYIEKPFSIKYFRQQIISLLDNRRNERQAFMNKPFFSVDNMKMTKADEEFMENVVQIITDNISDENFNVEAMAEHLCVSRSSLLRKIKTLFNLSPLELIRLVKLKKAAELIQSGEYRIGEVCFMVGINSSSYFSKLFYKQFGVMPKEFEKQCKAKTKTKENQ